MKGPRLGTKWGCNWVALREFVKALMSDIEMDCEKVQRRDWNWVALREFVKVLVSGIEMD